VSAAAPERLTQVKTAGRFRSFVSRDKECHVEYYFKGAGKVVTYPWDRGLRADDIEGHYDAAGFSDWKHERSGAQVLKAQHPEFETWSQGIHARSGVACADCHMPYVRQGAIKVTDHHVRSPLLNIARSCQVCNAIPETELLARAEAIQERTDGLLNRAEAAVNDVILAIERKAKEGAAAASLDPARALQRRAQWRLDFVSAENSMGFHAPQETARLLAEAIDFARQGQLAVEGSGGP
jgi:nitrite reductase (cytochrome c-552)